MLGWSLDGDVEKNKRGRNSGHQLRVRATGSEEFDGKVDAPMCGSLGVCMNKAFPNSCVERIAERYIYALAFALRS